MRACRREACGVRRARPAAELGSTNDGNRIAATAPRRRVPRSACELASPTPGGGSVAALTGALAAALGRMVAAFTLEKPKFAAVAPQVGQLAGRLQRAEEMLRRLIDEDAAAYGVLDAAFKLDKADAQRAARIAEAAGLAGSVPLETATLAARVLDDLTQLRGIGNPLLRSDADAARQLAYAALQAAAANVRANLALMAPEESKPIAAQLDALLASQRAPSA